MRIVILITIAVLVSTSLADASPKPSPSRAAVKLWLVSMATKAAPPATSWRPPSGPHATETATARQRRYEAIAGDIYAVAFDPDERAIAGFSRLRTAGFMMGMALGESGLSPDADLGPCYRGGKYRSRCDGGIAVGILQVWINPRKQAPYWADRTLLLRRGLGLLRGSFHACRRRPMAERLAVYGAGSCGSERGRAASRKRMAFIARVLVSAPLPR